MNYSLLKKSSWFDGHWYQATYPDVLRSGLEPEAHYLHVGERLGRKPSENFDPRWYLAEYPDVAKAGVSPLLHFITHGEQEGRLPCELEALVWESALWRQERPVDACLSALESLLSGTSSPEVGYAAFALGRWYAWQGKWSSAAASLAHRPNDRKSLPNHLGPELLTVEALGRSGQLNEAWQAFVTLQEKAPEWADTCLAAANLLAWQSEASPSISANQRSERQRQRLAWINAVWKRNDLTEIELENSACGLNIDNLVDVDQAQLGFMPTHEDPAERLKHWIVQPRKTSFTTHDLPLISVIVPAFKAANTLPTALPGLAVQRGVNLEVIVVDDASPDETAAVAEAFVARDARFRVIRQLHNQGAYAARNRGLAEARGEFITVHDSDDWSHPDKLATQLAELERHPEWEACCSHWVRCTPELIFGRWRMERGWTYRNVSSLMFRCRVFDALGYWDRVRVEADTEYYHRIRAAFGDQAIGEVLPEVPLAFGRDASDSLTAAGATHLVTQFSGLRADYREASQVWHRARAGHPQQLYLPAEPAQRPFDIPEAMRP